MNFSWTYVVDNDGIIIECVRNRLFGKPKVLKPADWPDTNVLNGRAFLDLLVEQKRAESVPEGVRLRHQLIAALSENQALLIGLPPSVPYALGIKSNGTIDHQGFSVSIDWSKGGALPKRLQRQGAIARQGDRHFRIPEVFFQILQAADALNGLSDGNRSERTELWVPLQRALEQATKGSIRPDGYLEDLKIFHAAAFSLAVEMDKSSGITFSPVLFGKEGQNKHESSSDEGMMAEDDDFDIDVVSSNRSGLDILADESEQLLPEDLQQVFLNNRFDRDASCREAYPLKRNSYVVFDKSLRSALDFVKKKQTASQDEKRAFLKNPRAALADSLGIETDSPALKFLFVETKQYADRITGIGLWEPIVLPWLPTNSNNWLPEKIGLTISGQNVEVSPEDVPELKRACEAALSQNKKQFEYKENKDIPADASTLNALIQLEPIALRLCQPEEYPDDEDAVHTVELDVEEDLLGQQKYALEQEDNLESLQYKSNVKPRSAAISQEPSENLMDPKRLLDHQKQGLAWMIQGWVAGHPGLLLADDMGLGKTFQTLAFAAWLHEHYEKKLAHQRGPILIVAPTALLRNWREEHDKHLMQGGIGPIVELYGSKVSVYRKDGMAKGQDVRLGQASLDRERLMSASVILTTYETLANYHISFAAVHFPLVIFDEIQKLKSPKTINTHAANTINADFVLGLTGTPVENNLTEIWSIMERVHSGLLGDLKTFNSEYNAQNTDSLRILHNTLAEPQLTTTPVMLRRMKDTTDLGKALPKREFISIPRAMPALQAEVYEACLAQARSNTGETQKKGSMLRILQQMRSISLHPEHPEQVLGQPEKYDAYIGNSARLSVTIELLDKIAKSGEKVLLFIEFVAMQGLIADILKHRYDMQKLPSIINGKTPASRRQDLVNEFQQGAIGNFDVMVLSPRAAGVGLTITAANHVIHLSRWWNPAVEDQCNDRAYRIGQDKPVTVYYPIARHPVLENASFDVTLDALLERKRALSRDLLVPAESESDFQEIFEKSCGFSDEKKAPKSVAH